MKKIIHCFPGETEDGKSVVVALSSSTVEKLLSMISKKIDQYPHVRRLMLEICVEMSQCAPPHIDNEYHLEFIEEQMVGVPVVDLEKFNSFLEGLSWSQQLEYTYSPNPDLFHAVSPAGSDGQPLSKLLDLIS